MLTNNYCQHTVSGNLTREQREIIKLVDIEGLKLEEACDELNMSLTPLKNKRIKAYTIMYKLFSEEGLIQPFINLL